MAQYPRYTWEKECVACKEVFSALRKRSILCPDCYKQSRKKEDLSSNNYVPGKPNKRGHRIIAEKILGRILSYNEVVHHLNEDPKDNSVDNLWVMSRRDHARLHSFLELQRVIWEKSYTEKSVNCWNIVRVLQTTAWLETTGAKVLKLQEFDNQQPSP